jgi:hypothetical protein
VNTCARITNFNYDAVKKIEMLFYHNIADLENLGFMFGSENVSSPYATTGIYLSTNKILYNLYWKGSTSNACAINVSAIQDGNWYKFTATIGTNISYKLNKMTIVDNEVVIGSDINSTSTAVGTQTPAPNMGIFALNNSSNVGVYSSKHRIAYMKFYGENDVLLYDFSFCNGGGTKIVNLVDGSLYDITNVTANSFHNYTQDFHHRNFTNGYTKYTKIGENDIRITNSDNGDQNVTTESGYNVVRVVGGSENKIWNGCESKVKFDDVNPIQTLIVSGAGDTTLNGNYYVIDVYAGKNRYIDNTLSDYTHFWNWDGIKWNWGVSGGIAKFTSNEDVATPDLVTIWTQVGTGTLPVGAISVSNADDLFIADKNRIWFDTSGVAQEIKLGVDFTCDMTSTSNESNMIINDIENFNTKNFYIYSVEPKNEKHSKLLQKIGMKDVIVVDNEDILYDENGYTVMDYEITF